MTGLIKIRVHADDLADCEILTHMYFSKIQTGTFTVMMTRDAQSCVLHLQRV